MTAPNIVISAGYDEGQDDSFVTVTNNSGLTIDSVVLSGILPNNTGAATQLFGSLVANASKTYDFNQSNNALTEDFDDWFSGSASYTVTVQVNGTTYTTTFSPSSNASGGFVGFLGNDANGQESDARVNATQVASITLDPGPSIHDLAPATAHLGQQIQIGTATPGVAGDTLSVQLTSGDGTITLGSVQSDGSQAILYTPTGGSLQHIPANGSMADSFTYVVKDQFGDTATNADVIKILNPATNIYGGPYGNSTIEGTTGADIITAYGWNNIIHDNGGNDIVYAGQGNATVDTSSGDVVLNLNGYNNVVRGGDGWVTVSGSQGNTTVTLGNGNDTIKLSGYNNMVQAGDGADTVTGSQGNSVIKLGNGGDHVTASGYSNQITTGTGNDTIIAGDGNETVSSGAGDDTITLAGWSNWLDAGTGNNMVMINNGGNDTIVLHRGGNDQISGYTTASNDVFDLRSVLSEAQLSLGGDMMKLAKYVQVSNVAGNAYLQLDASGTWAGQGSTLAVLHGVGTMVSSLNDLTNHGAIRIA